MNNKYSNNISTENNIDKFIDLDSRAGIGSVRGLNISTNKIDAIFPLSITQIFMEQPTFIDIGIIENKYSANEWI